MSDEEPAGADGRSPECQACPICTGLAALRQARPEVVEHLVKAGAELLLAARALLEAGEAGAPARRAAGAPARRPAGVQRIRVG